VAHVIVNTLTPFTSLGTYIVEKRHTLVIPLFECGEVASESGGVRDAGNERYERRAKVETNAVGYIRDPNLNAVLVPCWSETGRRFAEEGNGSAVRSTFGAGITPTEVHS